MVDRSTFRASSGGKTTNSAARGPEHGAARMVVGQGQAIRTHHRKLRSALARRGSLALAAALFLAAAVSAAPASSPELSAALVRLHKNPQDLDALFAAGNAALAVGDTDAAIGFFTRANALAPGVARIEAGLAGAKVMANDALGALPLFDAATANGAVLDAGRVADRGLAYDLVGDNPRAQDYYRYAMARGAGDEARRRMAMSLAISGDRRDFDSTLRPLTDHGDSAAWRIRAFGLAVLGEEEAAVQIARAYLPERLALGLAPYLRYMRRLTRAQQAAAANLGQFPMPADIGSDSPALIAWQAQHAIGPAPASPALASATRRVAPPEPRPSRETSDTATSALALGSAPAPAAVPPKPAPPTPTPATQPASPAAKPASFAEAFAGFDDPKPVTEPTAGGVDLRKLVAKRAAAKSASPPAPPPAPSRVWVQVGVGRDRARLATDWRRLGREAPRLFRGHAAALANWGRTHRLLVGPFASEADAKAWLQRLKPEHGDAFVWTSAAGEAVEPLAAPG